MPSPVDGNTRKNSFNGRPSIEPSTVSFAPPSQASSTLQARRHVQSIAIMRAVNPRSNDPSRLALIHGHQSSAVYRKKSGEILRA
jgi:hypothetical protein